MLQGWLGGAPLITTQLSGHAQLHRVGAPLGMREQLTFGDARVYAAWPAPGDAARSVVYAVERGGRNTCQLYLLDLDRAGRGRQPISDTLQNSPSDRWDPAGGRFAYVEAVGGQGGMIRVHERGGGATSFGIESRADSSTDLPNTDQNDTAWRIVDWRVDGGALLLVGDRSAGRSALIEYDVNTGTVEMLLDPGLRAAIGTARYAGDGRDVFFTSDMGAEFLRLYRLSLDGGGIDLLTGDSPADVEGIAVAARGAWIAYTLNEQGTSRLQVNALDDGRQVALPPLPAGVFSNLHFDPAGDRLAFNVSRHDAPLDVYSVDLNSRSTARWTKGELGGLSGGRFVAPALVHVPGNEPDAPEIPALVYLPGGDGPHPALVLLQAGVGSQFRPSFAPMIQAWVNELGIAVITPNTHGSGGYGKSYRAQAANADADVRALLDWLAARPATFEMGRIAIAGRADGPLPAVLAHGATHTLAAAMVTAPGGTDADAIRYGAHNQRVPPGTTGSNDAWHLLHDVVARRAAELPLLTVRNGVGGQPSVAVRQRPADLRRQAPHWHLTLDGTVDAVSRLQGDDYVAASMTFFLLQFLVGDLDR